MNPEFLRILEQEGSIVQISKPGPYLLLDNDAVTILVEGKGDLYSSYFKEQKVSGRRRFLFSLEERNAVLAPPATDTETTWMILPAPGSRFVQLKLTRLAEMLREPRFSREIVRLIEGWTANLLDSLTEKVPPRDALNIAAGEKNLQVEDTAVRARNGVLWFRFSYGEGTFLDEMNFIVGAGNYFPLNIHTWVAPVGAAELETCNTASWAAEDDGWQGLVYFHHTVLKLLHLQRQMQEEYEKNKLLQKEQKEEQTIMQSIAQLSSVVDVKQYRRQKMLLEMEQQEPLLICCKLIGEHAGINFVPHPAALKGLPSRDPLGDMVKASRVRKREVVLSGDWWKVDNGPLLGFMEEDGRPVAILPLSPKKYELHDPSQKSKTIVDEQLAGQLKPFAWMFYKPFPHKALKVKDILSFGLAAISKQDLFNVILLGLAGGLLGIVTPVAIGVLFGNIIPEMDRGQLFYMTLILIGSAVAIFMFSITQAVAMLRIETKMQTSIQASVWDRLLSLPTPFFRRFSAGDLSHRALSIHAISQMISGVAMGTILSSIFSVFSLLLLFYYDVQMALLALLVVLIAILITVAFGYYQVRYQRKLMDIEGKTLSLVLQLINGIAKFRVAGAESRAFYLWSSLFRNLRQVTFKSRLNEIFLDMFNTFLPVLASAVIFVAVVSPAGDRLTAGNFIAFNAAFSSFLIAMIAMSSVVITILNLFPLFERAKPIFETLPEVDDAKQDPGELKGEIGVSRLCFRYSEDGPLILNDVSLQIKPGEFIGVVGSSGSGKSTLFRCLLGFEQAESGMIFYDGQSLDAIDIQAVRQQMGVVLQNGKLMAADIFTNICGSAAVKTIDDAWEAARGAGVEDDIKQMPMGMHTFINEGATTISGGQRQRLLIARAIVNKPRILLFDEATSALDNKTQTTVSRTLDKLQATRVVVAHRLSTIINADRIYVMDKGKIVQAGNYAELIKQEGLFAELAKRQLA